MFEEFKKILKRLGPLGIFVFPILIIIILLFFALAAAGIIGGNKAISPFDVADNSTDETGEEVVSLFVGENNEEVKVEIADSPDEWEKGLMFRTNLEEDRGMLFVFPDEFQRSFWMKDTYVSLDIIFMNSDGVVLNFFESAEPLNTIKTYESSGGAKYVLELKGGSVERLKITVGEKIEI